MSLTSLIPANTDPMLRTLLEALVARNVGPLTQEDVRNQLAAITTDFEVTPPSELSIENAATPDAPVNLIAAGAFTSITLSWQQPIYAGHGFAEIYRAKNNDVNEALANGLHSYSRANVWSDTVAAGVTWFYFVRFVNLRGEVGGFAKVQGTTGETSEAIFDALDGQLTAEIGGTYYILNTAIQDAAITNAKIANLAVDNSKIANLDASKITAGTIDANRIGANTITADKMSVSSLSAISANLGSLTSGTITGGTVQTASSGARVSLSASGFQAYDSGNNVRAQINTDGSGWFGSYGSLRWTSAGGLYVNGALVGANTINTTQIAPDAITTDEIATNAINASHIQAGVITGDLIAANTILADNIYGNTLEGINIFANNAKGTSQGWPLLAAGPSTIFACFEGNNDGTTLTNDVFTVRATSARFDVPLTVNATIDMEHEPIIDVEYLSASGLTTNKFYLGVGAYAGDFQGDVRVTGTLNPFTASHECYISNYDQVSPGDIVTDLEYLGSADINNALFKCRSSTLGDCPIGVFTKYSTEVPYVITKLNLPEPIDSTPASFNAVGEGMINVCGENGNLINGDLICCSSIPGKGMKQADNLVKSITVAKVRGNWTFSSPTEVKQVPCIYLCG